MSNNTFNHLNEELINLVNKKNILKVVNKILPIILLILMICTIALWWVLDPGYMFYLQNEKMYHVKEIVDITLYKEVAVYISLVISILMYVSGIITKKKLLIKASSILNSIILIYYILNTICYAIKGIYKFWTGYYEHYTIAATYYSCFSSTIYYLIILVFTVFFIWLYPSINKTINKKIDFLSNRIKTLELKLNS